LGIVVDAVTFTVAPYVPAASSAKASVEDMNDNEASVAAMPTVRTNFMMILL
jgi:hypothetical protein